MYLGWESDDVGVPFHGRNLWPDAELVPGFRPAMTAYYHAMNGVAERYVRPWAQEFSPILDPHVIPCLHGMHGWGASSLHALLVLVLSVLSGLHALLMLVLSVFSSLHDQCGCGSKVWDPGEMSQAWLAEVSAPEMWLHGRPARAGSGFRVQGSDPAALIRQQFNLEPHNGRLLRLIALGFQLPSSFFDASFDAATSNVRAIHYLAGEHSAQDGVFGVGAPTGPNLTAGSEGSAAIRWLLAPRSQTSQHIQECIDSCSEICSMQSFGSAFGTPSHWTCIGSKSPMFAKRVDVVQ